MWYGIAAVVVVVELWRGGLEGRGGSEKGSNGISNMQQIVGTSCGKWTRKLCSW